MYIAGVSYERATLSPDKYRKIGNLWYDAESHHCSLLMHGIRIGHCFAKPYSNVEAPYLKGDIQVQTGEYMDGSSLVKEYLWCGFIWTESNQEGAIYQIVMDVDPTPVFITKMIKESLLKKEDFSAKTGIFLNVHLEDKEDRKPFKKEVKMESKKEETDNVELDNLPF